MLLQQFHDSEPLITASVIPGIPLDRPGWGRPIDGRPQFAKRSTVILVVNSYERPECAVQRLAYSCRMTFTNGDITSDGGVLLLRQVDKRLDLLAAADRVLPDPRDLRLIAHNQLSLLRQRVYGLCLGYEDLNDHTTWRYSWQNKDPSDTRRS